MSVLQPLSMVLAYPHARLTVITTQCLRLIKSIRDPYRPERHYMRGFGPRSYAKHQSRAKNAV
jgi:hypothetical protein